MKREVRLPERVSVGVQCKGLGAFAFFPWPQEQYEDIRGSKNKYGSFFFIFGCLRCA